MKFLSFKFLFFQEFSLCDFSEIPIGRINSKCLIFKDCIESLIRDISLEFSIQPTIVFLANQQLQLSSLLLVHDFDCALLLPVLLLLLALELLLLLLLLSLLLILLPSGLPLFFLPLLLLLERLLSQVLPEADIELDV